ncbi:LLM class flavin-dependent oxidoreductase [Actinoplanes regularis]|uniref:Flavin-dependent oxidoreductase, luciferase family (Includes alkanesulfonate monooxygenase SsuD and methylene tetrahydromethanopterin reductase) n=1 Tax=Actinoplanes regularis TaxID=52697 RepID=A0A238ZSJ1_9ACTN|nr:LLM class flavin-dependent oxidoreductase [Actinoplanes regularis]GIE90310.1 luciferase-like protein [Actinoplanes regularis]SNR86102.1 Flavin-dependent oxidoreductase, luciferase family (includes alkanesulfonate monooxygenase SsuD and methylene tetrahydromethanopterin reductase) [Actinoplanes regularis]
MIRLDVQPWGETLAEAQAAARAAEDAGAGVVWAPELHRSAFVTAAALATATSRIGVATGIALAFARSPMLTALAAADLDELSEGRFRLGLGTGVARLNEDWHGVPFERPVPRLRDTVAIVRAVLAGGDPIIHRGVQSIRVRGWRRPYPPARPRIPIYLAGVGPAMIALAGQIADGWIAHELCPPSELPALKRDGFDVVAAACCSVDPDPGVARRRAANVVGFYASVKSYARGFERAGFGAVATAAAAALHGGRQADLLGDLIPDEMIDYYTIAGTAAQCAARLTDFTDRADALKLSPPSYGLPVEETRAAQQNLLELVGSTA